MRVVSYVRMSTGRQEASPGQQHAAIEAHAAKSGYAIAREYADLGISGDRTDKRVGFQRMIADGAAGKFDRIVVYDRSRFGRFDSIEFGKWVAPLRDAGVELECLDTGVEDWSDFGGRVIGLVHQEAKHTFLLDLARATIRGKVAKVSNGRGYCGPTPYGYRRRTTVEGRNRVSVLEVDEPTAQVVRDIFNAYTAADGSLCAVAAMLNNRGVPPARAGERWRSNAVHRILLNEVYQGDAVWGRRQKGRYYTRQGTEVVPRKRGSKTRYVEPIRHINTVPALVSREQFALAAKLLVERSKITRAPAATRPLSGLVCCAGCGRPMHADGPDGMRCQSSKPDVAKAKRCPSTRVPVRPLVAAVLEGLHARLATPRAKARLRAALTRRAAIRHAPAGDDHRAALRDRHRELEREVAAGLERIPSMPASLVADYAATLERKAAERDRLANELRALPDTKPAAPALAVREALARVDELVEAATTAGPAPAVNAALRALGVRITVAPARLPVEAEITVGGLSTHG
jgi:DNA invertase Pin-like site-specific DNA recombinase